MLPFLLLLVGAVPHDNVAFDSVDLVEINHLHDDAGHPVFDQLIYYRFCPLACRYQVVEWRMLKHDSQIPQRDARTGGYVATWHDQQNAGRLRQIRCPSLRTTFTNYDPELIERAFLPKEKRQFFTR